MIKELRGQKVKIEGNNAYMRIRKPQISGNYARFSISDRAYDLVRSRYMKLTVMIENGDNPIYKTITRDDKPIREEIVPSKFSDSPDWSRFWFLEKLPESNKDQLNFLMNVDGKAAQSDRGY